jgi:two-component system chemotaxis response regulator CheY
MNALVVDDARVMRMLLRQSLQKLGYTVAEAGNGREGLERLQQTGPPDVVLVDCNMPDMDGLAFVQAVRADARYTGLPLVMVTGEEDRIYVDRALAAGANGHVSKPFDQQTIIATLQRVGLSPKVS